MFNGTINEVLFEIAKQLGLQWNELVQYANEAPYAAGRPDGIPWPSGTGSVSEKRILYAVAKGLKAKKQVDLGTRWGAMALQILTANPDSETSTIDIEGYIHGSKTPVGKFLPTNINYFKWIADCVGWLKDQGNETIGLIFEDTEHTFEMTKSIYELAPERLTPGGVIISHDACHPKFKGSVVKGIKATGIDPIVYLVEGDSCGLAIWQKPKTNDLRWEKEAAVMENLVDNAKVDTETPQEKPKRRKRKRKKTSKTVEDIYPLADPEPINKEIVDGIERIKKVLEDDPEAL
jgi:predicted O-methyltransferase YrrM